MKYLFCYDIRDEKRLRHVAKIIEKYGIRIQYSFFEIIAEEELKERIKNEIIAEMNLKEDSLYIYHLCNRCMKQVLTDGVKIEFDRGDLFIF